MSEDGSNPSVRPARRTEAGAVADLLYESAGGMYDRFAGGPERAQKVLQRAFAEPGNNASVEVVTVAVLDGVVAAALAAFPVEETPGRAAAFASGPGRLDSIIIHRDITSYLNGELLDGVRLELDAFGRVGSDPIGDMIFSHGR